MAVRFAAAGRSWLQRSLRGQITRCSGSSNSSRTFSATTDVQGIGASASATGRPQLTREPRYGSSLFYGIPIAVTFSLGVWQVCRLERKKKLIAERAESLAAEPCSALMLRESSDVMDHRRVSLSGRLVHGREMLVGPRSAPKDTPSPVLQWGGTSGFQVITPFISDDGDIFLVNRGWVPQRLAHHVKRVGAAVTPHTFLQRVDNATVMQDYGDGEQDGIGGSESARVSFTAIVRGEDEKNRFTPENSPQTSEWFYVDADAMAEAAGVRSGNQGSAPVRVLELVEPLPVYGWPHPRSMADFLEFRTPPSTHVTYAATWFSLCLALSALTRNRLKRVKR